MAETIISWTDVTWNPTTGCHKVSEGCRHCYAERLTQRYSCGGAAALPWTAKNAAQNVVLHPERLNQPYGWKKPCKVFVNSMSDLFHPLIPDSFLDEVFGVMNDPKLRGHTFQILTKRPERAGEGGGIWGDNIWMGTSIESPKELSRMSPLKRCGAAVKFISFEPLLARIGEVDLSGIDWVIVGGESGPGFRPMQMAWARELRDLAHDQGVPFFFKQDAAFRTETRPWLIEEDGSHTKIQQYPHRLSPPSPVSAPRPQSAVTLSLEF